MPLELPTAGETRTVTIVVPVYNEDQSLSIFVDRLQKVIETLAPRYEVDVLFTNNASEDGTLDKLQALARAHSNVRYITLARNFGYQASVLCGLTHTEADAVVVIDADCEDPPELIPEFISHWENGADIAYGRRDRRPEVWPLRMSRKLFYRLTHSIADDEFILDMAEFCLMTRRVRDAVIENQNSFPFIRNELAYVGFRRSAVPYARERRAAGRSHYNLYLMTQFAIAGILTASTFPLRVAAYLGVPLLLLDLALVVLSAGGWAEPGNWIYFLNLAFIVYVGMFVAVYVARIYKNGIQRPPFVVDWKNSQVAPVAATTQQEDV